MRKKLHCYKHIISINEKAKSKDQGFHDEKNGVIGMIRREGERERDSNLVQQMVNQDSYGIFMLGMRGVVKAILSEWVSKFVVKWREIMIRLSSIKSLVGKEGCL